MTPPTAPDRNEALALGGVEAGGRSPASNSGIPLACTGRAAYWSSRRPIGAGHGFTLIELLIATSVLALLTTLAVPPLRRQISQHRVRLAAAEVASALWTARSSAVRHGVSVAVRFETDDSHVDAVASVFSLYADGDGDGVRTADLNTGTDPRIRRPARLLHVGADVRFGFPEGLEPRGFTGTGRLDRLDDPVRFGSSDLASFSPVGTASPGSVFVTDGYHLFAVRVYNRTGKVRILRYVRDREEWKGL